MASGDCGDSLSQAAMGGGGSGALVATGQDVFFYL